MSFSGTVSQTRFTTRKVLESAFRRCRQHAEQLTAEHWDIAQNELYLLLGRLANTGVPLWCVQKLIMPIYPGTQQIALPTSINDVLNSNLRYLSRVEGSNSDTSTTRTVNFGGDVFVTTVGVLWSGASVPIALERSFNNIVWETIQTETPEATLGQWTWFDLVSSVATQYFRVRATTGMLGFSDIYLGNNPTEIQLARMNRDDWWNLPNRAFQSDRPLQFWLDRSLTQPTINLWPVPSDGAAFYQLTLLTHRYVDDVGTLTQEIECPQRWYAAIVCKLACALAREIAEVDAAIIPQLDADALEAFNEVNAEERDNSPFMMSPNISCYTC